MAAQSFTFSTGSVTKTGCVRDHNEDRLLAKPEVGVWLVADGMGGHEAGDKASEAIVSHMESIGIASSEADLVARFADRLQRANAEIRELSRSRGGALIGSTVAGLVIYQRFCAILWCGDSRVYRIRHGVIEQLSRDHTEVQALLDRGLITSEEAQNWPRRNVITRAVGIEDEVDLDFQDDEARSGDLFILCSDGLTGHVADGEILELAEASDDTQDLCDRLVDLTYARGASDNVTVIAVACSMIDEITAVPAMPSSAQ
ncbi:Serine/threonine phosphatase stp [Hartmannibacter diazotrophicus]|uniref:Serine/threonine phosphatase stp n=1 Tax=Hartmannibacter diazotrophicus TaxID=1482074 RepID=A0A2C9D6S3_9HYPH|nr:protein phosphatase 2C domain-containing protein [Hartmannibacter diazotrophicus]SON55890.1 Serine/threonine phosphatase stp [Hartmannibacter diazotrophicus]